MPNYSLVANSTFQPFTYQELMLPIERQNQYFEKLAQEYDNISKQADVLEAMGKNDRDKESGAYSRYKSYSDALRNEADNLYRFGLNTESRQRLTDIRRRYNTDIVPIQNAWNKREQEADLQMKAQLQNPSLMFTRDARNTNLDDYISNPTGGYGVINGANITAQMSAMAKNLEKQVLDGSVRKEDIDPYTYNYIRKYGLTTDMIRDWRNNPTLSRMFNQVMEANGVTPEALKGSVNAQNIIDKSTGYAEMGMWSAVGEDRAQQVENYGARLNAQAQKELDVAMAKKALESAGNDSGMGNIPSVAVGMESVEGYTARNKEILDSLKTGSNGLKSSYFGRQLGSVNPMTIYEEYQEELKKHTVNHSNPFFSKGEEGYINHSTYSPTSKREPQKDIKKARDIILNKYRKYGVTDILSDDQYEALSSIGYSKDNNISSTRHSDIMSKFNDSVTQKSRYSTHLTSYESFNDTALPNLRSGRYRIWEIGKKGKIGSTVDVDDLNIYSKDNTKGNTITDVQYDPEFKDKIVIQLDDGKDYVVDPSVFDSNLTNMITRAAASGAHPQAITARIKDFINTKNKVQSKTDSKIEVE